MNRIPLYGTVIVLCNCGATVWHLLALAGLHSMLSEGQIVLIVTLVNLIPFTAAILLWTRFRTIGGWLLLASLGIGLLIGIYEHFLRPSPNNVFRVAPGEWTSQFRITAVPLMIVEGLGCWIGVKASMENQVFRIA
jgi:hypothetical protein